VREVAKIPQDEVIMTYVAMGYPADNFAANAVRSGREHNEQLLSRVRRLARWSWRRGADYSLAILGAGYFFGAESWRPLAISIVQEEQ
jgi:hypothetical protein